MLLSVLIRSPFSSFLLQRYFQEYFGEHFGDLIELSPRLPQRVVMKLNERKGRDFKKNLPPNVMVSQFVAQQAILGHNKTILFFTHFGQHREGGTSTGQLFNSNYGPPLDSRFFS